MDLTKYYQNVRDEELSITEEFPIVVSKDTGDGGRAGVRTEVPRRVAAKLLVEGLARLANASEAESFRTERAKAKEAAEQAAAAARVPLAILSQTELARLQNAGTIKE